MSAQTGRRITDFKARLEEQPPREVVQRFITGGVCVHLTEDAFESMRMRVARNFQVHPTNIFVVGSAKLGFSIAPEKRWTHFNDESDIDVAIVSPELYLAVWRQISDILTVDPTFHWRRKGLFAEKHLMGWLRPDALPPSPALVLADEWFEFFRALTAEQVCGPYRVNAGLYYDIHFLEQYQERAVEMCKETGEAT